MLHQKNMESDIEPIIIPLGVMRWYVSCPLNGGVDTIGDARSVVDPRTETAFCYDQRSKIPFRDPVVGPDPPTMAPCAIASQGRSKLVSCRSQSSRLSTSLRG